MKKNIVEITFEFLVDAFKVQNSKSYFTSWSKMTAIMIYTLIGIMISIGAFFSYPSLYNRVAITFGVEPFNGNLFDGSWIVIILAFIIAGVLETGWSFSVNQIVLSVMKKAFLATLLWSVIGCSFIGTSIYFQNDGANEFVYINTEKPTLVGTDKKESMLASKDKKIAEYTAKIDAIEKQGNDLLQAIDKINSNKQNYYTSTFSGKKVMKTDAELALLNAEQRYKNWENTKDKKIESFQKLIEQQEKNTDGLISSIDKENGAKVSEYENKLSKGQDSSRMLNILIACILFLLLVVISFRNYFVDESDHILNQKKLKDMEVAANQEYEMFLSIIDMIERGVKITTRDFALRFGKGETNTSFAKTLWNKYKNDPKLTGKRYDDYFGNSQRLN